MKTVHLGCFVAQNPDFDYSESMVLIENPGGTFNRVSHIRLAPESEAAHLHPSNVVYDIMVFDTYLNDGKFFGHSFANTLLYIEDSLHEKCKNKAQSNFEVTSKN